jgi:hypothetical protein
MYVWLDLQKTGYGFGNGSLRSLAVLVLRPAEPSPLASLPSFGTELRMGALIIFVHNRRGSSSPSVVATGTVLDLLHLLRLGMGRAQSDIAFFTPTTVLSRWRLRRSWTGTWRRRRGECSQLPKAQVVLALGLVLYGGGLFISVYTTKPV